MSRLDAFKVDVPTLGDVHGFHVPIHAFRHALEVHEEWLRTDVPALLRSLFREPDVTYVYETRPWPPGMPEDAKATPHLTLIKDVSTQYGFGADKRIVVPCLMVCERMTDGYLEAKTFFPSHRGYPLDRRIDHSKHRPCVSWEDL